MNRYLTALTGLTLALLTIGGCSTRGVPHAVDTPASPVATAQPAQPAGGSTVDSAVGPLSPRGARPWKVGDRIQTWGPPMSAGIGQYITVTAIKPLDPSCPQAAVKGDAKPVNGRFLTVEMTVEDTPAFDASQSPYYVGSTQQFAFVGADGTAVDGVANLPAFYCTNKMTVFRDMQPGRTYKGFTNVDIPAQGGWLIFGQDPRIGPGYEFEIPAA